MHWNEYTKLLAGILALTPPPIVVPIYLSLVANYTPPQKKKVALISTAAFAITLILFAVLGDTILHLFGITLAAFRIAGGLLLLTIGYQLMYSSRESTLSAISKRPTSIASAALVPLAIPILAGPGTISTIIIYANSHATWEHTVLVSIAVITAAVINYLVLRLALVTDKFVDDTINMVFNRIMGLIITAIAIEFILDGLSAHYPILLSPH